MLRLILLILSSQRTGCLIKQNAAALRCELGCSRPEVVEVELSRRIQLAGAMLCNQVLDSVQQRGETQKQQSTLAALPNDLDVQQEIHRFGSWDRAASCM